MFIDDDIISNLEIIYSFFGMMLVYFISYIFMKRNKIEENDLKRVRWMAFGISLIIVGVARVILLSDQGYLMSGEWKRKLTFSIKNVESVAINANIKLVFYFPIFDQFLSRRLGDL